MVGDQLRKGAATNAVQIAELLLPAYRPPVAPAQPHISPGGVNAEAEDRQRTFRLVVAYDGTRLLRLAGPAGRAHRAGDPARARRRPSIRTPA